MTTSKPPEFPDRELKEGDRLGPYEIMRKLGSGGMADVFFAVHASLHRPAAIKVLKPNLATDQSNLQRFMQEARAAASLVHPNIVQVYDVGQEGEIRFIAQEYVAGVNLKQYITQHGPLAIRQALSVLLQTLAALKKSSGAGIIHRDIKPENILLTSDGDVKVTDFGLARVVLDDDPQLTRAGTTLGTPMYMSPEQLQDGEVDVRSDIYSLGVTMFHVLTGRPPFNGDTSLAIAMQHVQAEPPSIAQLRSGLPAPLVQLVHRMLAKKPEDRYENPDAVLQALRSGREEGLAEHWPEQTIPLPGADKSISTHGPSPAALKLQAALNRTRSAARSRWTRRAGALLLLAIAFGIGGAVAASRPLPPLFGNSENMYFGVAKQPTVEKQYRSALLLSDGRNRTVWEAVPHFYPPDQSLLNRDYAGKAWLQLARLQAKNSEERGLARETLGRIVNDNSMDDLVKALAWLEMAAIATQADDDKQLQECLNKARSICSRLSSKEDQRIVDDNVPDEIQGLWNSAD